MRRCRYNVALKEPIGNAYSRLQALKIIPAGGVGPSAG
jgi:hypothetical protein